jgi:glycosyltransferase involved in cell wall biosynthesis
VISTAIAGIPDLVDDTCGWLIPAGSEEALVEAMTAALRSSAEELSAKGAVGCERVLKMHDADRNAADLVAGIVEAGRSNDIR